MGVREGKKCSVSGYGCKIMVDPRHGQVKTVMIVKHSYGKSVPQNTASWELAVWVEFASLQWNTKGMKTIRPCVRGMKVPSCKGTIFETWNLARLNIFPDNSHIVTGDLWRFAYGKSALDGKWFITSKVFQLCQGWNGLNKQFQPRYGGNTLYSFWSDCCIDN